VVHITPFIENNHIPAMKHGEAEVCLGALQHKTDAGWKEIKSF